MNIPYKKEFISYPDIAAHHQKLGIQANEPEAVKFECPSSGIWNAYRAYIANQTLALLFLIL